MKELMPYDALEALFLDSHGPEIERIQEAEDLGDAWVVAVRYLKEQGADLGAVTVGDLNRMINKFMSLG